MRRILVASSIIIITIFSFPAIAFAPNMVANEIAAQKALGYEICEPNIAQLPEELRINGIAADAIPTPYGETCEIRFAHDIDINDLDWLAWHEVCHLSTLNQIMSDPHRSIIDSAHSHPEFQNCIAQGPRNTGGY